MDATSQPGFPIWHVWRDPDGVSHQNRVWLDDFRLTGFIEGVPGIWCTPPRHDLTALVFLTLMPDVDYGWHENPVPQWIVPISGRWYVTTMDGVRVEMGPGDISFGADQNCREIEGRKGHLSGAVGPEPAVIMLIQAAADPFEAG